MIEIAPEEGICAGCWTLQSVVWLHFGGHTRVCVCPGVVGIKPLCRPCLQELVETDHRNINAEALGGDRQPLALMNAGPLKPVAPGSWQHWQN